MVLRAVGTNGSVESKSVTSKDVNGFDGSAGFSSLLMTFIFSAAIFGDGICFLPLLIFLFVCPTPNWLTFVLCS